MIRTKERTLLLLSVSMCVTQFMWVGEENGGEEKKKKRGRRLEKAAFTKTTKECIK